MPTAAPTLLGDPRRAAALALALLVVAFGPMLSSAPAQAADRAFCRAYTNRAVNQIRRNANRGCGFRGGRWSNDRRAHFGWCRRASRGLADWETRVRRFSLREICRRGGQPACRNYAQGAVRSQRQNLSRRCGLRGGRWSDDYQGHYTWCRGANTHTRQREVNERIRGLRRCGGSNRRKNARFRISQIQYPGRLLIGARARDIKVYVTGRPRFPVTMTLRARSCPRGQVCPSGRRGFRGASGGSRQGMLLHGGGMLHCAGVRRPRTVAYVVTLRDADGHWTSYDIRHTCIFRRR